MEDNKDLATIISELVCCIAMTVVGCTVEPVCPEHAALTIMLLPAPIIGAVVRAKDLVMFIKKRKP